MGFLQLVEPDEPKRGAAFNGVKGVTQSYADTALRNAITEMSSCTEGGRNDKLNILAYGLRPFIVAGILDELYVTDQLTNAARIAGLYDVEIEKTIQSGYDGSDSDPRPQYVLEAPQNPSQVQPPSEATNFVATPDAGGQESVWGDLPPVDGAEWMFNADDTQVVLWGEGDDILWAEGEALMIAGGMGLGKTTLAGRLVRGLLGLEDEVLELPIATATKPILYLAMDRPRQIRRSFRRQFKDSEFDAVKGKLIVRPGPPIADLAVAPMLLAKMAQEVGAGTVFVDSLKDAVVGLSEDATAAAYNRARQGLLAKGINICELHHTRKTTKESTGGIGEIFGSTWLAAGAGSVIIFSGEPGDPVIKFKHAKQPANEVGPFRVGHDPELGVLTVVQVPLYDLFVQAGANGVTAKMAAEKLYETHDANEAICKKSQRYLDKLVRKGFLVRMEGHRGGPGGSMPTTWFVAPPKTDERLIDERL